MDKPKILIVDDKKENLFALEEILDELIAVVDVVTTLTGNDAVSKCLETEFAIILMDVQMPGMDGFEAMELIHRDGKNKDTPVIFLSAIYSDDFYKIKGLKQGAVDFISKPVVEGVLIAKINVFLLMYRQKKQMIEQMEKIQVLNRDLENFNKIMAHDMKQPLTVIKGAVYIALNEEKNMSSDTIELLQGIDKNCNHMNDLINEVLELIRIQNAAAVYESCDVNTMMANILDLLGRKVDKKIEIEIPVIPKLKSQPSLLYSIFKNLVENSLKYNENHVVKLSIAFEENQDQYVFHLRDNGIGISESNYSVIFEPFQRGNVSGKYSGSGVGLSIVKSAVERLGGKVFVEASGATGTTVCFSIAKNNLANS